MGSPGYYDLPGSHMLPGGGLATSPGPQGEARSMSGIDVPLPGSGGPLTGDYRYSIPGAGLPGDNPTFGGGDPYFNYNPNTIQNQYIMGGFAPLELGKLIYGGFNPQGASHDPAIALGRSIAHGFGSGIDPDLSNPNYIGLGTPSDHVPSTNQAAAQAYASIAQPTREFGGTGFGQYAQAQNNFIPGLIAWNGPGQAQDLSGSEPDTEGARNFMGLARRLGGMGITHDSIPVGAPAPQWASAHLPKIRGKG